MISECRKLSYPPIVLIILVALLCMGACTNPEKAKAAHLAKGEAYLKESKFQEASIEFRNALQIDDKLAAAHWGLSKAYEGLQRLPESLEELRRTVDLDGNNLDAKVKLGNFYIASPRPRAELIAEAEKFAKEILQKDPNHIEGHILLGSVLFAQGQRDQSLAELNRAVELDPKRVESYLSLARFYVSVRDTAKAEETFQRAITLNSTSALAHTEYGKYLVQLGKPAEAEAELVKAVAVDPNDRNSRFVLASFYLVNKQLDKAEFAYKELANLDKDKPQSQAVLADFYSLANRPDEAIRIYQDILAKSPDFLQGRYRLTEILMQSGKLQEARAQIDDLLKKDERNRQALLIRARVRLQSADNKEIKAAVDDLKEVLRQEPNSRSGLYFMAQANFNLGLTDQARVYLGELERNYPEYLAPKLMQMQISLITGDPRTTLRLANELFDLLAKTPADSENTPQLLAEIRQKTFMTRGTANVELGKFVDARKDFMAVTEMSPNYSEVYNNLAVLSIAEQKPDDAIGFYDKALSLDATNTTALNGLINLYAQQQHLDLAHARVDSLLRSNPNNASLHFLKAQVHGYERNESAAEAELRKALELDPDYINAYYSLASLFINTKQEDRAIAEYRRILERRPDTSGAYTVIGMLEEARKNYPAAVENYRKALELDPGSTIAGNNLAWMYATQNLGNLDEAVRLAQAVVQKTSNVAGFVDTLGWVYFKKGLYAAAVEQLQKAVDLDASAAKKNSLNPSPTYPFHLGMALKAKGERDAARHQLETALKLGQKVAFNDAEEARKALATL